MNKLTELMGTIYESLTRCLPVYSIYTIHLPQTHMDILGVGEPSVYHKSIVYT